MILLLLAPIKFRISNGFSQSIKNDLKLTISGIPLFGFSEVYKNDKLHKNNFT
jgi:hypothetical protein